MLKNGVRIDRVIKLLPFNWTKLKSGIISEVKFVPNKHDLRGDVVIRFNEGKVYKYQDVPRVYVEKMVHSKDPGDYFEDWIRPYYPQQGVPA